MNTLNLLLTRLLPVAGATQPQVIDAPPEQEVQKPPVLGAEDVQKPGQPPMYAVILHNDNSTNPYFVQRILVEAFRMDSQRAWQQMMAVHMGTHGVMCILAKDLAETRLEAANTMIRGAAAGADFEPRRSATGNCELRFTIELETKGD